MGIDADLEVQYNARAAVPEHAEIQAGWRRRSEKLRASHDCSLDLAYADGERQKIDLFRTAGAHAPLLTYVHGGYWQRGERRDNHFVAETLCERGVNVALVGYQLCPAVSIDTIVDQVRAALAWLWRQADALGFDAERIQICGHSAGGHLTAMAAATDWPDLGEDLPADLIHSALAISGLYALGPLRHTSINAAVGLDADAARRNSPAMLPGPTRLTMTAAVGSLESAEFHRQARSLAAAWPRTGVSILEVPGSNHFTILEELAAGGVLAERALTMLGVA